MGRKTKLNEKITKELVSLLKSGCFVEQCVRTVGITKTIYYRWLKRGEAEITRFEDEFEDNEKAKIIRSELKYVAFVDAIREAEESAETAAVINIKANFLEDWKASAWFLERRYPQRWGRKIVGFSSDDGTKSFADAFSEALKEADDYDEQLKQENNVTKIH